ncbi:hypothetical protein BKA66DRAFT_479116 [Pyrenochaeta sp. MPI-SDFR-AT-0127]|nr:hypothetical protein BKA66DRAFT_479116 [Pyrenochaeta sp. MPI-SDFR-AT-0127]
MDISPGSSISHALQACRACKQGKRRCDKRLPECSLCQRTGRKCNYADPPASSDPVAELAAMRARLDDLEERIAIASNHSLDDNPTYPSTLSSHNGLDQFDTETSTWDNIGSYRLSSTASFPRKRFPTALFLDIDCFILSGMQYSMPSISMPMEVLAILTEGDVVIETSREYFNTIHSWMPIISKKRMDLGIPAQNPGPDLAMLFLSMKLITTPVHTVQVDSLYRLAKGFLTDLECHGVVSLLCLQATVLVALYEYSHAIYPGASMTIGVCTRYAELLGISCRGNDMQCLGQSTTWTEVEEKRRVWWAIFILDRLISMGNRRPCSLSGPSLEAKLPVDDEIWDSGNYSHARISTISASYQMSQSPFARLCQAATYLDRALSLVQANVPIGSNIVKITALAEEVRHFCITVDSPTGTYQDATFIALLSARCVARSALFVLLDKYTCPEQLREEPGYVISAKAKMETELEMQTYAANIVQQVSMDVSMLADEISAVTNLDIESRLSPFVTHVVYCTIATFHWYSGENGSEEYQINADKLDAFLGKINLRWRLAGEYHALGKHWKVSERARGVSQQ